MAKEEFDEKSDKEEEKLDFTTSGEALGYIGLDQAGILCMQTAAGTPGAYGSDFPEVLMAFGVVAGEETDDYYVITLSFRPQGEFAGTPGQEQFFVDKEGTVAHRQVLGLPRRRRRLPIIPVGIGLAIVGVVAVGGVWAFSTSTSTPSVVEKQVVREVPVEEEIIKEAPVEKEVIKEVIKEVPVEVIKEVIKEVPVEVIKEVIKEVPVEVIKEVIKEVPVEVIKEVIKEVVVEKIITPVPVAGPPKYGGHINARAYADTRDWDPLGSASLSSVISYSQLYNQIVQYDTTNTDQVTCDLCTSWDVTNGGKTITFQLNPNVKWHDGRSLSAKDAVFSLTRYMESDLIGRSGLFRNYTLSPFQGGVKIIDDLTFEMNLRSPSPAFLKFLAIDYVKILPKHLLERGIDLNKAENVIRFQSGSGPFVLNEYQRGNFYKVSKSPNYFKEGRPFVDSINHFIIVDRARAIATFKTGQIDMTNSGGLSLTPKQFLQLQEDTNNEIVSHYISPSFNVGLMINVKREPFRDPRVRRAIYLALDRQQINDAVLAGTGGVTTIFPPGMAFNEDEALSWPGVRPKDTPAGREDLAEAKRLMAEAGFPDGFKTSYNARQVSFYVSACQIVKEQLKSALGIDGDIRTWESAAGYLHFGTARAADAKGDWSLACQGEGMTVPDADVVFGGIYRKGGTRNYTDWSHPLIDDLFERQKEEQDPARRRQLLRRSADFLRSFEDNHWITLAWGRFFWPVHRDIKGFNPPKTVQYGFKHEDLWLDR